MVVRHGPAFGRSWLPTPPPAPGTRRRVRTPADPPTADGAETCRRGGGFRQGAGSREQGAGSREQGAGSREQGGGWVAEAGRGCPWRGQLRRRRRVAPAATVVARTQPSRTRAVDSHCQPS
ncbi:hypothetical protein B9W62_28790 [Streptomyces sp. CS113]|nr:hypothetical protein B9W62_28790 [Streptomyces sp. CS113]